MLCAAHTPNEHHKNTNKKDGSRGAHDIVAGRTHARPGRHLPRNVSNYSGFNSVGGTHSKHITPPLPVSLALPHGTKHQRDICSPTTDYSLHSTYFSDKPYITAQVKRMSRYLDLVDATPSTATSCSMSPPQGSQKHSSNTNRRDENIRQPHRSPEGRSQDLEIDGALQTTRGCCQTDLSSANQNNGRLCEDSLRAGQQRDTPHSFSSRHNKLALVLGFLRKHHWSSASSPRTQRTYL